MGTSPVTLEPAVTYSAQFPADYSAINQFQTTSAAYLASNLLKTGDATSSNGTLDFTSTGKAIYARQFEVDLEVYREA